MCHEDVKFHRVLPSSPVGTVWASEGLLPGVDHIMSSEVASIGKLV